MCTDLGLLMRAKVPVTCMQVQHTLESTTKAVSMNKALLEQLGKTRHRTAALSLDATCASCRQPLRSRPRCSVPQGALRSASSQRVGPI